MYYFNTNIRVRYSDTDQMGFVYYGVYAQYYEVGRVELLRSIGLSYKRLEDMGYSLPVVSMNIKYKKPAFYDDLLTVKTIIRELPSTRINFNYEIFNQNNQLLNISEVSLVFVDKRNNKPCLAPDIFLKKIIDKFNNY